MSVGRAVYIISGKEEVLHEQFKEKRGKTVELPGAA
jgi:hypothetical protein